MIMNAQNRSGGRRTLNKSQISRETSHGTSRKTVPMNVRKMNHIMRVSYRIAALASIITIGVTGSALAANIVPLDVATVTTGGTAVVALTQNHRSGGGWLQNPPSATVNLCINERGTAVGTTSSGDTTCIIPGQSYVLVPNAGPVSVISSDSSHPFSGYGIQQ